jgi:hypothetical protein
VQSKTFPVMFVEMERSMVTVTVKARLRRMVMVLLKAQRRAQQL